MENAGGHGKRSAGIQSVLYPARDIIAGTVGGAAGVIVGQPLDTVRIRLQQQPTQGAGVRYHGILSSLRKIAAEEGVRGLFKGMLSPLSALSVTNAVLFGVNGAVRQLPGAEGENAVLVGLFGGAISGVVTSFITCPTELVKIRLQVARQDSLGSIRFAAAMFRAGGIRPFFQGMNATLIREVPGYAVYFGAYEGFKHLLGADDSNEMARLCLAGGLAGVTSWGSVYPLDYVKTHVQLERPTHPRFLQCARHIVRTEGFRPFFKGFLTTVLRAFPVNAATFVAYETVMERFER